MKVKTSGDKVWTVLNPLESKALWYADRVWCRTYGEHLPINWEKGSYEEMVIKAYKAGFRAGMKEETK